MRGSISRLVISTYCSVIRDNDLWKLDFNLLIEGRKRVILINQLSHSIKNCIHTKKLIIKENTYLTFYNVGTQLR